MLDYFIVGVIAVVVIIGIIYTVKHFRGQSGCCGGGGYKPRRKKLSRVLYQKTFKVDGMQCEHCKNRVEEVVNDIEGVSGKVDLKNNILTVFYAKNVSDEVIKARVESAGYGIVGSY